MNSKLDKIEEKIECYKDKYLSNPRLALLKICFHCIKEIITKSNKRSAFKDEIPHIAIGLKGGMGDFFINAKYVYALKKKFASEKVEITLISTEQDHQLVKDVFKILGLENDFLFTTENIASKIKYDLFLEVVRFPKIKFFDSCRFKGELSEYVDTLYNFQHKNRMLMENDFLGKNYSMLQGRTREDQADIANILAMKNLISPRIPFAKLVEIVKSTKFCKYSFIQNKEYFITVQVGSGNNFNYSLDTRSWPTDRYVELITAVKSKFPNVKFVQLGDKHHPLIKNVDYDLRGKTTNFEFFSILGLANLHISQEGGSVIARHFITGNKSIVLFGPTDAEFFGYPENVNISNRKCYTACEWLVKDWMNRCSVRRSGNACIHCISVDSVVEKVENIIKLDQQIKVLRSTSKIHFINRIDKNNVGDWYCSPLPYYFDFFKQFSVIRHDIDFINFMSIEKNDLVILGGSGLFDVTASFNSAINKILDRCDNVIAWSAGFNTHNNLWNNGANFPAINFDKFSVCSIRDFNHPSNFEWLPCPSVKALEKYKNLDLPVIRKIGVIEHKDISLKILDRYDHINNSSTFEEIVNFIISSEVIITNSYHCAYWTMLLEKKCIVANSFSSKFDFFKYKPEFLCFTDGVPIESLNKKIEELAEKAQIYKNCLNEALDLNDAFFERVKKIVKLKNIPMDKSYQEFYQLTLPNLWNSQKYGSLTERNASDIENLWHEIHEARKMLDNEQGNINHNAQDIQFLYQDVKNIWKEIHDARKITDIELRGDINKLFKAIESLEKKS